MPGRYVPTMTPDRRKWVILDRELYGYCTLPDNGDPSSLLPLEWNNRAGAEAWLRRCYRTWQTWEGNGKPVPQGWRPFKDTPNPFEGFRPYQEP